MKLEDFGNKIYFLLVENFPQTFFVGGMVRDGILGRKITDVDITTSAKPNKVANLLRANKIICDASYANFGVIVARQGSLTVEIATLRTESYGSSRYPKISYTKEVKTDAARRDFTVNAMYLQAKKHELLDYFGGQKDLKNHLIRFIGDPKKRIKDDPLRIIRALRFCLKLNFRLEQKTKQAIKNNFNLIKALTSTKLEKEIFKLKNKNQRVILKKVINRPLALDKYFK